MTTFARRFSAILGLVVVPVACAVFAGSCGSDPVGIEPCRVIETARCEALKSCGSSDSDVTYCIAFYRDQCLHGVANTTADLSTGPVNACVDAIRAVSSCAATGAMTIAQCSNVAFVSGADPTKSPCTVLNGTPQLLSACAFLATEDSTSSSSSSTSSSSSGAMPDGGDDAGDGG